jgi:mono/diheme cytochrome c family protein
MAKRILIPIGGSMRRRMRLAVAVAVTLISLASRAEVDKKTERLWKAKCASCHGADGKGQTDQGKKMGVTDYTTPGLQKEHTDAAIEKSISEGVTRVKDGKKQEMEPFKGKLDAAQISALVAYIRTLK